MALISFWMFILFLASPTPDTGSIDITIDNIESASGTVKIALYRNAEDFPNRDEAFRVAEVKARVPEVSHTFKDIPQGDYAIAIFHDKNQDDELNFKLFFIPKEPYGFSNNFIPRFSKPAFDDARFLVQGNTRLTISLID